MMNAFQAVLLKVALSCGKPEVYGKSCEVLRLLTSKACMGNLWLPSCSSTA